MIKITPIILCGGFGERLWPLSRKKLPKQFVKLPFLDNKSLLNITINRILSLENSKYTIDQIIFICNESHKFLLKELLETINLKKTFTIILEPFSKNTAPAITLGALHSLKENPNSNLLIFPSDHWIEDQNKFSNNIWHSLESFNPNDLFIYGASIKRPEINYGYIESESSMELIRSVKGFIEKPSLEKAKFLSNQSNYSWNMGIFLIQAKNWLSIIKNVDHELLNNLDNAYDSGFYSDQIYFQPCKHSFKKCKKISIDYLVLESFKKYNVTLKVMLMDIGWTDLGTFDSIDNFVNHDKNDNYIEGKVTQLNSSNNFVINESKDICLVGAKNLLVINTNNILLICNKDSIDSIRELIKIIDKDNSGLLENSSKQIRPWGFYEDLEKGKEYKLKRIHVNPFSKLSYQSHEFRDEHWYVLDGLADIKVEDTFTQLNKNMYIQIKKGQKHQLINNQDQPLILVEVQSGKITEESDITRYEDIYGRE